MNGVLEVVGKAAKSLTWTVHATELFHEKGFSSAPFEVDDGSYRLLVDFHPSINGFFVECLSSGLCSTYCLRLALEATNGDTLYSQFYERVNFVDKSYTSLFSDLVTLRRRIGDSGDVRLVATFYPLSLHFPCHSELSNSERGGDAICSPGGVPKTETHPGVTALWTLRIPQTHFHFESTDFDLADDSFRLWIDVEKDSSIFVRVQRERRGEKSALTSFVLTIQTTHPRAVHHRFVQKYDFNLRGFYQCYIMEQEDLSRCLGDIQDLRIACSLFQEDDGRSVTPAVQGPPGLQSLSRDLKELLLTGRDSDLSIEVQEEKFSLHRLILSTRCPFFGSMLKHDMAEKNTGVVKIPDYTAEDFRDFLLYLYTGRVESLTPEKALSLYRAADQYDVQDLKTESLDFIQSNLSVDTLGDVITLSLHFDEKELFQLAKRFFTQHVLTVVKTASWKRFWKENFDDANEMYIEAVEAMAQKSTP